ncbi:TPA: hypothetical protein HA251_01700 [Candidatus Woesearchaeota archaeon]|nr:hypothetical protein [Candidatus Woesearchaeota archaeon]
MNAATSTAARPHPLTSVEEGAPARKRSVLEQTIADELTSRERLSAERNSAEDTYALAFLSKLQEAVEQIAAAYMLIRAQKTTIEEKVQLPDTTVSLVATPKRIKAKVGRDYDIGGNVVVRISKNKEGVQVTARRNYDSWILPPLDRIFDRGQRTVKVEDILNNVPELGLQQQYLRAVTACARALNRAIREQEFSYKLAIRCSTPEQAENVYRAELLDTAKQITSIVTKD